MTNYIRFVEQVSLEEVLLLGAPKITEQPFENVWDALAGSADEASSLKAKADILRHILAVIEGWDLTQKAAAGRLGTTQSRLNDLMRGRIHKFSLDTLVDLATRAGLQVEVSVTSRAA